jgi:hypothetical protein
MDSADVMLGLKVQLAPPLIYVKTLTVEVTVNVPGDFVFVITDG